MKACLLFLAILLSNYSKAQTRISCPPRGPLNYYIDLPLFPEKPASDLKLFQYFFTKKPFEPSKQTIVMLDGGPGGFEKQDGKTLPFDLGVATA